MMKRVQRKIKKRESGRSMVEIVGVLAATGLLTAGAFVLVTSAMASQKISRAQDDITNISTTIQTMSAAGPDFSNLGCSDETVTQEAKIDHIVAKVDVEVKKTQPCNNKKFMDTLRIDSSTPFGDSSYYGIVYDSNYPDVFGVRINSIDAKYCAALNYKNFKNAIAGGCDYTYKPTAVQNVVNLSSSSKHYFTVYFTK